MAKYMIFDFLLATLAEASVKYLHMDGEIQSNM